ncbi:DNA-3-methyladenine glycosylase [Notoacmeibacter sp. MSK16QG-6]|uniref:DNA-3-methyladenine glycosylase family protein n=1 Tax=Notoacmeibacter sp. MSK16QG-6 TaxID=2957982 RepID=UPI00209E7F38|nr:DNA-3-methyladenine glycosylase 2 family protein [Notoacmeibacter sp. MSK16QG-6]MCP1199959.1 DNA-3-methyladenine glycosylase 2 family protein [Notoacmeibacter sp. MSK16QG-6]
MILDSEAAIARSLGILLEQDPDLTPLAEMCGPLPARSMAGGYAGLAAIVVAQQVSKAAADTIFRRLKEAVDPLTGPALLSASDEMLRGAGLSRPKIRTLRAVAEAERDGLSLDSVLRLPAEEAVAALTPVSGIGRWTAECWLLFAAGHPDIFPSRDLALQAAAHEALGLDARPDEKTLSELAKRWAPNRSVAARLLWAWYGVRKAGGGAPV